MAALRVIDISMNEGSCHMVDVGRGHVQIRSIAINVHFVCGSVDAVFHSKFDSDGDSAVSSPASSS